MQINVFFFFALEHPHVTLLFQIVNMLFSLSFFGCAFGSIPCREGDPNVGERCFVKSTLPWRSEATRLVLGDPNGATNISYISYYLQCFFLHGSFVNTI